ncbi:hypothetical protein JCM9492_05770 [Aquifex pyrophilus]
MYISLELQEKILKLHNKCTSQGKVTVVILKNIQDFDPSYVEFENKIKTSSVASYMDIKVYGYNFENDREVENAFKFISYENPDVVIILSNSIGSSLHKKLLIELSHKEDIVLCTLGQKPIGTNGEIFFDIIFSSGEEFIKFFEKTCEVFRQVEKKANHKLIEVKDAEDVFKKFSQKHQKYEEEPNNLKEILEKYEELKEEVVRLKEDIEVIKEFILKKREIEKEDKDSESGNNVNILINLLNVALLITLIILILVG